MLSLSQRGVGSNSPLRPLNQSQPLLLNPPLVCLAIGFGLSGGGKYLLSAHFPSLQLPRRRSAKAPTITPNRANLSRLPIE